MESSFYASIADNYDYIFPYNALQVEFINKFLVNTASQNVLEVGCGTGNLSFGLANNFNQVEGVDLDDEMLERAKAKNNLLHLHFQKLNMLKIEQNFELNSIDNVVCFGNTLVHLRSIKEIESFIKQIKQVLVKGGSLFIQIINYNRIINQNIQALETIENDQIQFIRNYIYLKKEHIIDFRTQLTLKNTKKVIKNSQLLYPLQKEEIENVLRKYFDDVTFCGNFKGKLWDEEDTPLIIVAK